MAARERAQSYAQLEMPDRARDREVIADRSGSVGVLDAMSSRRPAPVLPFTADEGPPPEPADQQEAADLQSGFGNGVLAATHAAPELAPKTRGEPPSAEPEDEAGGETSPVPAIGPAPGMERAGGPAQAQEAVAPTAAAGAEAPTAAAAIDVSGSAGLLDSLARVPVTALPEALAAARGAVPSIQQQERLSAAAAFPEIQQPTGLPSRIDGPLAGPTQLPPASAPSLAAPVGSRGEQSDRTPSTPSGPVPGSQASVPAAEPAATEEEGSWWDWLVDRVSRFLRQLPTSDPELSTSAGPRSRVDVTGEADPAQTAAHLDASDRVVGGQKAQADAATSGSFGENEIFPTVPTEMLRPTYTLAPPPSAAGGAPAPTVGVPADMRAMLDEQLAPLRDEKANEALTQYRQEHARYEQTTEETRAEGDRRIAEQTELTRAQQLDLQRTARAEVDVGRQRWREENQRIRDDYAGRSLARRLDADLQITTKVATTDAQAAQELTNAEGRAEAERIAAERRVADEKRRAESRPRSWWQRFKGAVADAFATLKRFVTETFEALRRKVREIIEAAKATVRGWIDAARDFVVGVIKAFGEAVKGLVDLALSAFPDAAARAREWIDQKVNGAVEAVNEAAEALKAATDAILDWIGASIDTALAILQAGLLLALDVLDFVVTGFLEVLEWIVKLHDIVTNVGPIIETIVQLIKDPTPIIEAIKAFIGSMIAQAPAMAVSVTRAAITFSDPPPDHWEGIWSHLKPKLDYLSANWWTVIKQSLWHLIWPFAEDSPLWKDAADFWSTIKLAWAALSAGKISKGIDHILRIIQLANHIVGLFYGWVALGLIAGYAIAGGIAGAEAGVLPGIIAGAAAGAAQAAAVGTGLAIAALISEGAVLAKAGYNLVFQTQTAEENEEDYERIAGSGLTVAIIGAMFAIAWLGKLVASAIIKAVFGRVFRRPPLRGRGTTSRGDIIELRVLQATRVVALLRGRVVTWLELLRRNFPVIDLLEDGVITITQRPGRAPLYRITGGRLTSVKSSAQTGAAAQSQINAWVDELANFNAVRNVSVVNPTGRRLVVALETPVDSATAAALRTRAAARGVDLELTGALPAGHPAGVFPDAIPGILAEAGVTVGNEVPTPESTGQPQTQ
jgi:hypothetical protein